MDVIKHLLGIGITLSIELMASPLVRKPVLPILNDIVDRDIATSHFSESTDDFILGGIALPALPESE